MIHLFKKDCCGGLKAELILEAETASERKFLRLLSRGEIEMKETIVMVPWTDQRVQKLKIIFDVKT